MMTDKALADTLELMASEIAALKRQIGELQQRERVDSNSFSISTHAHPGIYLPLNPFNLEVGGSIFLKGYNIGEWQTWTPTLSAGIGVFTNATVTARYMVIGKTVFIKAIVVITTNGTAGAFVKLTLPIPALAQVRDFISGEAIVSALGTYLFSLGCSIFPSTDLRIYSHDGTYPGADGRALIVSGAYEIA